MGDLLDTATRCPHCRASVRPGAPWCTLCHADLRPAPEPPPPPVLQIPASAAYSRPAPDPLTAPAAALGLPEAVPGQRTAEPTWPCSTCGVTNPLSANACAACGAGFLAGLRETEGPLLELPGVGDLTRLGRGQRLMVALGVVLAFLALTALVGFLFS